MVWMVIRDALLLLALASFAYYVVAIIAALRFFRGRDAAPSDFTPPLSILKPIYGLDRETELASLHAIREADGIPTWLGAHAVPPEFADADAYLAPVGPQTTRRHPAKTGRRARR